MLRTLDGFKLYLDDIQVRKDDPVGLIENQLVDIVVYPNPSSDQITIQNANDFQNLEILDLNGKILISSIHPIVQLATLSSGTYLVRCHTTRGICTKKISKI